MEAGSSEGGSGSQRGSLQPLSSEQKGSCHLLINLSSGTRDHFLVVGSAGAWKQGAAWRLGGLLCL